MAESTLFDIRSDLWRRAFTAAQSYDAYVESGTVQQQEKWRAYEKRLSLKTEQLELLASFNRRMSVLVLSGIWCGDCARQGPILAAIGAASPTVEIRFLDNQAIPEVRDELRVHGASRVPVVVTLSEDYFEVGRSLDRTLSVYRRKAKHEIGAACDAGIVPPNSDESSLEVSEWIEHFERQQILLRLSPFLRARHGD
jgi:hypothetical protein